MSSLVPAIHWLAAVVVLAEALNKLERAAPLSTELSGKERVLVVLKAIAWSFLALGSAGALITPLLGGFGLHTQSSQIVLHSTPSIAETATMVGVAFIIIRTRIKEG